MPLRPGNFLNGDITDYGAFVDSMAAAMDEAFRQLMVTDGMPPLKTDPNDPDVRHRRRLFVAIARGVVLHLAEHEDSFRITLPDDTVVTPDIDVA